MAHKRKTVTDLERPLHWASLVAQGRNTIFIHCTLCSLSDNPWCICTKEGTTSHSLQGC